MKAECKGCGREVEDVSYLKNDCSDEEGLRVGKWFYCGKCIREMQSNQPGFDDKGNFIGFKPSLA
jgi:hypothetical protein